MKQEFLKISLIALVLGASLPSCVAVPVRLLTSDEEETETQPKQTPLNSSPDYPEH